MVISDWGRAWEWQAGLRLLSKVHELRPSLPVIFYHGETGEAARAERAERLRAAGAFGEAVYPAELFTLVLRALQQYCQTIKERQAEVRSAQDDKQRSAASGP